MRLNINLDKTVNYADLQSQISDQLVHCLDTDDVLTFTRNDPDPESLNLTFFIRESGQAFMSHSLADRNYLLSEDENGPLIRGFQMIFVPGEWTRRALLSRSHLGLSPRQVVAVGHPRIDLLRGLQAQSALTIDPPTHEEGRLRLLWAPAHDRHGGRKGMVVSSYPGFEPYLDALQVHHDVTVNLHPRNRRGDKSAVTQALVDCDVVITDASAVMFEAWAIGKPVIFPRWIVGDSVVERFSGAAEGHVHSQRIGLHADSFEEMLEMLSSGPVIGDDVHAFMTQYLVNYAAPTSSSAARLMSALRPLAADPNWLTRLLHLESSLAKMVAVAAKKGAVMTRSGSPRASLQMLQLFALQDQPEAFAQTLAALRAVQGGSARLMADVASIECDYRLTGASLSRRNVLLARLEQIDSAKATTLRARLALLEGQTDVAFDQVKRAIASSKTHGYATWRLVVQLMHRLGFAEMAMPLLEKIWAQYKAPEVIEDMLAFGQGEEVGARVLSLLPALRKLSPSVDVQELHLRALWRAGQLAEALVGARKAAVSAATLGPGSRFSSAPLLEGWGPKWGLPVWHLPFEGLDQQTLAKGGARWSSALTALCAAIEAEDLPFFLSRATLRHALSETAPHDPLAEVELGLVWQENGPAKLEQLARAALLEPAGNERPQDSRRFRLPNGVVVVVRLHHLDGEWLRLADDGVETRLPIFELARDSRGGRVFRRPSSTDAYLTACFGATILEHAACAPLLSGQNVQITDPDRLRLRLYHDVVRALGAGDTAMARICGRVLYRLGDRNFWIELDKMDKAHFCEDLSGLLEQARFILHVGDGVEADFHVDLWYPYLKAVDPATIVAIRSKPLFDLLRRTRPELQAIYIKAGIEAEWLVSNCPKLVAVHYLSNTGSTVHFLRFNHLTHVWLGHGDSEKAASCHKFFRAYDEIWCAGKAQVDRFRNSGMAHDSLQFRVVGRPLLRSLIAATAHPSGEGFLYLPTWEGFQAEQEYTSVRLAEHFIPSLVALTGQSALVKFHPWVGQRASALNEVESRLEAKSDVGAASIRVIARKQPVDTLMPEAGFLVADISSVVSDYLPTGRPIFLYMPDLPGLRIAASAMPMDRYCYIFRTPAELLDLVRRVVLEGNDDLAEARQQARAYFVDVERTMSHAFEAELRDMIFRAEAPGVSWVESRPVEPRTRPEDRPLIVGHRGVKSLHPENSLSGFEACTRMEGLDAVEFDLHLTSDDQIVVLHDPTLHRTTDGTGPVSQFDLQAIKRLRLRTTGGSDGTSTLHDEGVPTLDEVLDVMSASRQHLFVELKNDVMGNAYPGLAKRVLGVLRARGMLDRCTLTSFSPEVLRDIRLMDASVPLMASVNYRSIEMLGGVDRCLATFDAIPGCAMTLHHEIFLQLRRFLPTLDMRRFGIWVLNTEGLIRTAHAARVRQIFTDRPEMAIALQAELMREETSGN